MSDSNNSNNNKKKISTGNPWLDLGITIAVAVGGAVVGEVGHRVSELRSRNKAKKIAVETNNNSKGED